MYILTSIYKYKVLKSRDAHIESEDALNKADHVAHIETEDALNKADHV